MCPIETWLFVSFCWPKNWRVPQIYMRVSENGGTPSHHPFYFRISHEINHPAIGVSQLQGERSTAADMCRYMDQRLQAGLQLILGFWGYLEVGHGFSMAGFDCMVPTYPVEVQIQWFDSWMTIRFGDIISCRNMQKAFFRKMLFSWRKNMPPPAWDL
jgi:hypothetical protein